MTDESTRTRIGPAASGGADLPGASPAADATPSAAVATPSAADAKVLRSFFRDGRLVSIPAQDRKKLVVLRHLRDVCFAEDRAYPEREVNQRLGIFHPDVAALRRYLVDFRLMSREAGEYRRA